MIEFVNQKPEPYIIVFIYSGSCCSGSITLEASAAVVTKWPKYFGQYTPTGKRYHRSPVYINKHSRYLFINKKGAWSANDVLNERGVLRGTGRKNGMGGKCVTSVTDWKLWDNHEWRSANITASCVQGIQLDVNFFDKIVKKESPTQVKRNIFMPHCIVFFRYSSTKKPWGWRGCEPVPIAERPSPSTGECSAREVY